MPATADRSPATAGRLRQILCALLLIAAVGLIGAQRALALTTFTQGTTVTSLPSGAATSYDWGYAKIACGSAGSCVAAGYYQDTANANQAVVQPITDGAPGPAVTVPFPNGAATGSSQDGRLDALSCWSAGSCFAVGYYEDTSGHEHALVVPISGGVPGTSVEVSLPTNAMDSPGNTRLNGVSCWSSGSSGSCMAVGSYVSTAHGYAQALVVPITDGTVGSGVQISLPANASAATTSGLSDVSCWSAGSCVAVGSYNNSSGNSQALVVPFSNGSTEPAYAAAGSFQNATLSNVDCPAAGSCVAVGNYIDSGDDIQLLEVAITNGAPGAGAEIPRPSNANPGGVPMLFGLGCSSSGSCDAVGDYETTPSHNTVPLVAPIVNGAPVTSVSVALPSDAETGPGSQDAELNSVSCVASGPCLAVGDYYNSPSGTAALAVTVSGTSVGSGIEVAAPDESSTGFQISQLQSVGCSSSGSCAVIGEEYNPSNVYAPYVVSFESPLSIGPSSLPSGALGVPYQSTTPSASGGWGTYSWSISSGSLPAGLSLNAQTGVISGTPTAAGSSTFTIQVTAAGVPAQTATQSVTLDVVAPAVAEAAGVLKAKSNRVEVSLACSDAPCDGPLELEVTELVTVKHGKKRIRKHRTIVIGSATFSIAAGQSSLISLKLNATGQKYLKAAKSHRLSVTVLADAAGGNVATRRTTLTETLPKAKHRKKH